MKFEQQVIYARTAVGFALEAMEAYQKGEADKKEIEEFDIPEIEYLLSKVDDYLKKDALRALNILKNMIGGN